MPMGRRNIRWGGAMDKRAITDTTTTQAARLKGPEPKVERVWEGGTMLQKSAGKKKCTKSYT